MAELDTNVSTEATVDTETAAEATAPAEKTDTSEIARLRAEVAKQKAALDKATKEAGDYRKQLRAKQSAEEVAAEEAKALQQSMEEELKQLRKEKAVAAVTSKVMPLVGDTEVAGQVAEYLYGAEDADAALAAIQKAWTAKEKALRLEYGKIPAPGVGSGDGTTVTREQLDKMSYKERVEFAYNHHDEYERLMGRK